MSLSRFDHNHHQHDDWKDPFRSSIRPFENRFDRDFVHMGSTDIIETKKAHVFRTDAPGLSKDDIHVQVHDNDILTISGERRKRIQDDDDDDDHHHYHRVERSYGKFNRSFRLPDNCDPSKIQADFKDGVLTVSVPKTQAQRRKSVDVDVKWKQS